MTENIVEKLSSTEPRYPLGNQIPPLANKPTDRPPVNAIALPPKPLVDWFTDVAPRL